MKQAKHLWMTQNRINVCAGCGYKEGLIMTWDQTQCQAGAEEFEPSRPKDSRLWCATCCATMDEGMHRAHCTLLQPSNFGDHPVKDAMEEIDAAIFTGDYFEDQSNRVLLRSMMFRWERGLKGIDDAQIPDEQPPSRPKADIAGNPSSSLLRISIESVPHKQQRYDTCGDYFEASEGEGIVINVSELPSRREMILIAIHELIEWALCESEGITNEDIDSFDMQYEENRPEGDESEPGDDPNCPVYKQHQFATGIERILAAEMGIDWLTYERHIAELDYSQPVEPLTYDDDIPF